MSEGEANPRRGGGPKTAAWKAVFRLNPLRHGVLAQTPSFDTRRGAPQDVRKRKAAAKLRKSLKASRLETGRHMKYGASKRRP
jgi:hypothetical protein